MSISFSLGILGIIATVILGAAIFPSYLFNIRIMLSVRIWSFLNAYWSIQGRLI